METDMIYLKFEKNDFDIFPDQRLLLKLKYVPNNSKDESYRLFYSNRTN